MRTPKAIGLIICGFIGWLLIIMIANGQDGTTTDSSGSSCNAEQSSAQVYWDYVTGPQIEIDKAISREAAIRHELWKAYMLRSARCREVLEQPEQGLYYLQLGLDYAKSGLHELLALIEYQQGSNLARIEVQRLFTIDIGTNLNYLIQYYQQEAVNTDSTILSLYDEAMPFFEQYLESWTMEKKSWYVYNERSDLNFLRREYAELLRAAGRDEEAQAIEGRIKSW